MQLPTAYQTDQHSVHPSEHIGTLVGFSPKNCHSSHYNSCAFLVESGTDVINICSCICPVSCYCCHSNTSLTTSMLQDNQACFLKKNALVRNKVYWIFFKYSHFIYNNYYYFWIWTSSKICILWQSSKFDQISKAITSENVTSGGKLV